MAMTYERIGPKDQWIVDDQGEVTGVRISGKNTELSGIVTSSRNPLTGGVEVSAGGNKLSGCYSRGINQFIRRYPEIIVKVARSDGAPEYSAVTTAGGGAVAVDTTMRCPLSGLPMLKMTLPAGVANQTQTVSWNNMASTVELGPEDSWIIPVYVPPYWGEVGGNTSVRIGLWTSSNATVSTNYRTINIESDRFQSGWSLLTILANEVKISSETGVLGTTLGNAWTNTGSDTVGTPVKSISIRVNTVTGSVPTNPYDVYIGCPHYSQKGWIQSAVMWGFDDVSKSAQDIALPILEEYGFKATFYNTVHNAGYLTTHLNWKELRALKARGHAVWSHTLTHQDLRTLNDSNMTTELTNARDHYARYGMLDASRCMAYPYGKFDRATVTKMRSLGYAFSRATGNYYMSNLTPGLNPLWTPGFSPELSNPWQVDAFLNGVVLRGAASAAYAHTAVIGGAGVDTRPGVDQFYTDHLRRWCEMLATHVAAGNVVCPTQNEYYSMAGIDTFTDTLPL